MIKKIDIQEVAQKYLEYYRWKRSEPSRADRLKYQDALFTAWEYVDNLVRTDPNTAWDVTKLLISLAESEDELSYIAAGPFKDLLAYQPQLMIDVLMDEARKNTKMRRVIEYTLVSKGSSEESILTPIKEHLHLT